MRAANHGQNAFTPEWLREHVVVDDRSCWLWQGADYNERGYGKLMAFGVRMKAHRWFYTHFNGHIPAGLCVLHKCDVTKCVNPAHLELGTHADNNRQRHERGRDARQKGEMNARSKLNEATAREVLRLRAAGLSHRQISQQLNIGLSRAKSIANGHTWSHLERSA